MKGTHQHDTPGIHIIVLNDVSYKTRMAIQLNSFYNVNVVYRNIVSKTMKTLYNETMIELSFPTRGIAHEIRFTVMWTSTRYDISSAAQQNDVNDVWPGTHHSARRMRLKSWQLLQPTCIANLSFVHSICRNFKPSKSLSSSIISCNFIHYANNGMF